MRRVYSHQMEFCTNYQSVFGPPWEANRSQYLVSGIFVAKKEGKNRGVREPRIDLSRRLDALRRHFLIAMVVIIKDRMLERACEREGKGANGAHL